MRLSFSSETIKITGNVKSLVKFEKKKFKLVVWDIATIYWEWPNEIIRCQQRCWWIEKGSFLYKYHAYIISENYFSKKLCL